MLVSIRCRSKKPSVHEGSKSGCNHASFSTSSPSTLRWKMGKEMKPSLLMASMGAALAPRNFASATSTSSGVKN